jgi:hypothetical protein
MFKSLTLKSVALSVCEAEQTAGVLCAQDMICSAHPQIDGTQGKAQNDS